MLHASKPQNGFTLLEALISVLLFAVVFVSAMQILLIFFRSNAESLAVNDVNHNVRLITTRIGEVIHRANTAEADILSPAAGTSDSVLIIRTSGSNDDCGEAGIVCFSLNGNALQIQEGTAAAQDLTTSIVTVSTFTASTLTNNGRKSVQLLLRIKYSGKDPASYERRIQTAFTLPQ